MQEFISSLDLTLSVLIIALLGLITLALSWLAYKIKLKYSTDINDNGNSFFSLRRHIIFFTLLAVISPILLSTLDKDMEYLVISFFEGDTNAIVFTLERIAVITILVIYALCISSLVILGYGAVVSVLFNLIGWLVSKIKQSRKRNED